MHLRITTAALVALAALTAGCTHEGGAAEKAPATPSGYPEMQKKVAAAESALARADKDAAQDTER
ncbi:hypothetical protein [Streptomyces sp. NPDC047043]|uniref:hypothetical protein n=1 Tax=Streptomyces sp. NPDC047043 TaxID=3154497 RepID=UPI0033C4FB9B